MAATQPPLINVLLADDHPLTLWGLRQLVESARPQLGVAGTASTCAELLAHPALPETDVVLLDLGLSDRNAVNCIAQLVSEVGVKVVLLTGDLNPSHHREAVLRGARGVVLKSQPTEDILEAIQRVHGGDVWFDRSLMAMLLNAAPGAAGSRPSPKSDAADRIATLTARELLVVQAMVRHRGAKSLVVAESLGMSENTLRNHLTVIYGKLGVQRRLNLYLYAVEHRLALDPAHTTPTSTPASTPGRQWGQFDSAWNTLG